MSGESLKFGTSGLRGLVVDLEGAPARRHVRAFLAHLEKTGRLGSGGQVLLGRDLRPSSASILADCAAAIRAAGLVPVDCGALPTPALALHAMAGAAPAIMVTGSHIPADRNGLKFYAPEGEITKADEAGILAALRPEDAALAGATRDGWAAAQDRYRQRYRGLLPFGTLSGWRIGVFEHASVATDLLASLLYMAGAEIERLGRSDAFVPVDTEAFGDAVFSPLAGWIEEHRLDALVSTDADGDRPLLVDRQGRFIPGDVLGLIGAGALGADAVVTPVTANSGIERSGLFASVVRTKVGSPFVVAGLAEAAAAGARRVVGFEANGGLLLGSDVEIGGRRLSALPTRDAVLPILLVLAGAARQYLTLAELVARLPLRPSRADRLTEVPMARSWSLIRRLGEPDAFTTAFFAEMGPVEAVSALDGARITLASGEVVHYRASGNAPELRCYVEADGPEAADRLLGLGLAAAQRFLNAEAEVP